MWLNTSICTVIADVLSEYLPTYIQLVMGRYRIRLSEIGRISTIGNTRQRNCDVYVPRRNINCYLIKTLHVCDLHVAPIHCILCTRHYCYYMTNDNNIIYPHSMYNITYNVRCIDAVHLAAARASDLQKVLLQRFESFL